MELPHPASGCDVCSDLLLPVIQKHNRSSAVIDGNVLPVIQLQMENTLPKAAMKSAAA
jgi:hypothetical protein